MTIRNATVLKQIAQENSCKNRRERRAFVMLRCSTTMTIAMFPAPEGGWSHAEKQILKFAHEYFSAHDCFFPSDVEIATARGISMATVNSHLNKMMRKGNFHSRWQMIFAQID